MKIIKPSFEIMDDLNGEAILKKIERCGRVCYKSEGMTADDTAASFVMGIIKRGHESVLEHVGFTIRFICDRGVSHELVRHRIASFSQESTRYCNYILDGFGNEITVIKPGTMDEDSMLFTLWKGLMWKSEKTYFALLENGSKPQQARSVLPNSLKTEVVMTANIREWRHFLKLRTAPAAHPDMRELTLPLLKELKRLVPVVFDDIDGGECNG